MEWLLGCEIVAFGVVYWCGWVEGVEVLRAYLGYRKGNDVVAATLLQKIAVHPYLLFLLILLLTSIW